MMDRQADRITVKILEVVINMVLQYLSSGLLALSKLHQIWSQHWSSHFMSLTSCQSTFIEGEGEMCITAVSWTADTAHSSDECSTFWWFAEPVVDCHTVVSGLANLAALIDLHCPVWVNGCVSIVLSNSYDTIRDAVLTCAQKLTSALSTTRNQQLKSKKNGYAQKYR